MQDVKDDACCSPEAEEGLFCGRAFVVKAEDADRREVHAVQDACTGGKVVQFLREVEVSCVKDHAEGPAGEAEIAEENVVFAECVRGGDLLAELGHSVRVREVIKEGEEDAEGFLHAEETVEGPFAVELVDGLHVGRVPR